MYADAVVGGRPVLTRKRRTKFLAVATAATFVGALSLLANTAFAASNPPGNNGTVKIHTVEAGDVELDSVEANRPHVGCPYSVSFFGFDEGDIATVTFTAWSPTPGPDLLTDTFDIGADDNSGGGSSDGFDGAKTYKLDFGSIEPQPQQGFHVKLTVSVTSPGSKTPKFNKFKVFWTEPCEEEGGGTTTTTTTTTTLPGGGGGGMTTTTTTTLGGGAGPGGTNGALPFTGNNTLPMVIAGLLMVGVGAASLLVNRLRQRRSGA
jgi:hypothetical protein